MRPFQKAEFEAAARALEPWLTPLLQMSGDANAGSGGCRLLQGFQQRMSESAAHLRSLPAMADGSGQVVTTVWTGTATQSRFTPVRPIPVREDWFETVWRNDRARRAKRCF